jgi:hypothetical protein
MLKGESLELNQDSDLPHPAGNRKTIQEAPQDRP